MNVAGSDVPKFIKAMLGWTQLDDGNTLRRYLPEAHPVYPWLYADEVSFSEPLGEPHNGGPGASLIVDNVKLLVTYRQREYQILNDAQALIYDDNEMWRFVTIIEDMALESVLVPGNTFQYEGTSEPIPEPPARLITSGLLRYTWHQVPAEK